MEVVDLITRISIQLENNLPVVAFRKPNENLVNALIQPSDELIEIDDYSAPGFLFSPFVSKFSHVFFPYSEENFFTANFESESPFDIDSNITSIERSVEKERYLKLASNAVDQIKDSDLEKVVLSRSIFIQNEGINSLVIFEHLLSLYPNAFVYIWFHPKIGMWLGATPEQLLKIEGKILKTVALAGTKARPDEKWTKKEFEEQQYVVDSIKNAIKDETTNLSISEPETVKSGSVFHLKSTIRGRIEQSQLDLKSILKKLHPTPAVCGTPRNKALEFITSNEGYSREYYSGYLGMINRPIANKRRPTRNVENQAYFKKEKLTDLYVNLRCLKFTSNKISIYVGGGITKDSNPEDEWTETVEKSKTMLAAIPKQ